MEKPLRELIESNALNFKIKVKSVRGATIVHHPYAEKLLKEQHFNQAYFFLGVNSRLVNS